ncbi:MAG: DPP IV N-terminal domain-containing protein [Pseudomonadota bacterium]
MLRTLFLPAAVLLVSACAASLAQTSLENTSAMVEQKPLTIERLFASPSLSGSTPSGIKYSPDGKRVTFLKARDNDGSRYDLWQFDVATGEQSMLVDSKLLEPEEVELSEEEKALRERKRIAGRKGIVSYDWGTANTILVPLGGDLHLVTVPSLSGESSVKIEMKSSAAALGISLADVSRVIREAYFSENEQRLPRLQEVPIAVMNLSPDYSFEDLTIETSTGDIVPLLDVVVLEPHQRDDQVKVRQLTATDAFEYDAKVSPGGGYVSFIRDGAVYVIDLATGDEELLTPLAEPDKAISYGVAEFVAQEEMDRYTGYWWSPDDRYLAYTKIDESTVDIIPRFDIAAEDVTVINQRYPRAGRPNAVVDLFVRDMESGEVTKINWRRDDWGPATDQYLARVYFRRGLTGGENLFIGRINRDQTDYDLTTVRMPDGSDGAIASDPAYVFTETHDTWINLESDFSTSAFMYTLTAEAPSGVRQILASRADGQETFVSLTPDDFVVSSLSGVFASAEKIYFTGYGDTPLERHLYAIPIDGGDPVRITEPGKSWSVAMAPDGRSFVGTSSSPNQPPQTGLYRIPAPLSDSELAESGAARLPGTDCVDLTPSSARVTRSCPEPMQLITWIEENKLDATHPYAPYLGNHTVPEYGTLTAEDGQTLYYSIQLPPDFDARKTYPALVETYGGPHAQTVNRNWERLSDQYYSRQGYVVFRLDNRGMANRGKAFEDVIYRQMGIPEVRDLLVGVDWLKSQPFVDGDRVGIQGWSYGGYMTMMTILQAPEGTFAAAVAGAPVTDWALYDTFYTERYMDTPQDNAEGYEKSSVFYYLDRLVTELPHLMLIHGMADDNVTFDNTTRLMAELQQRGIVFDLMTYPGQRHGIRGQALGTHLMKSRMTFLDRHLK